jgi:hypothetical protein
MKALFKIKVGDELAGSVLVHNINDLSGVTWSAIAANPIVIADVTALPLVPAVGSSWDGEQFDIPSDKAPLAGYVSLAFIVDGKCAHVMPISPEYNSALIAAFRTGATIEVELDPPGTYDDVPA